VPKYRLPDEPSVGPLGQAVVEPTWPLLASMIGGAWIGWPWFVFNAHAVGSPSRWRQTALVAFGFLGACALLLGIALLANAGVLEGRTPQRLALLGLVAFKLTVSYVVFAMQWRSVQLFEYYRGVVRNGIVVVVAAWFLEPHVMRALPSFLARVLS
jgi:hypothetical protein